MKGNLFDHEKLARLRKEKYSQKVFADLVPIDTVSLSRIENGHSGSYEVILRICQLLGVDSKDIFYSSNDVVLNS